MICDSDGERHLALVAALAVSEPDMDLGCAALAIALEHDSHLDFAVCLRRLDALAADVRRAIGRRKRPETVVEAFHRTLVQQHGFYGNADDYYNPTNSLLYQQLEQRTGLQVTLSIVYLCVVHRLQHPLYGVGMPLDFIVKYADDRR